MKLDGNDILKEVTRRFAETRLHREPMQHLRIVVSKDRRLFLCLTASTIISNAPTVGIDDWGDLGDMPDMGPPLCSSRI